MPSSKPTNNFFTSGILFNPKILRSQIQGWKIFCAMSKLSWNNIKTNKESKTRLNWKCISQVWKSSLHLLKISMSCLCCAFLFLKVFNWSVTFLSLAHVLFISASISSTWPPSPAAACEFKLLFIQTPKLCQGTADQTRQTNIMLPRWKRTSKELQKLMWASFTQQLS